MWKKRKQSIAVGELIAGSKRITSGYCFGVLLFQEIVSDQCFGLQCWLFWVVTHGLHCRG